MPAPNASARGKGMDAMASSSHLTESRRGGVLYPTVGALVATVATA
jgi:hypothetical protein